MKPVDKSLPRYSPLEIAEVMARDRAKFMVEVLTLDGEPSKFVEVPIEKDSNL